MKRIKGESRFLPNLHFDLSSIQLSEVRAALTKLEGAHRSRVVWAGPYALEQNQLSINALDLFTVLCHCNRAAANEMELFRLRRTAIEQIEGMQRRSLDDFKIHALRMWLESYAKLWPGEDAGTDLTQPPTQPNHIDFIP